MKCYEKKILHIVRYSKDYPGGAEKVAHTLAEYLNMYGWKSNVLSFRKSPGLIQKLVKNYIIPKPSEITRKINEFHPDVIHIHALRNGYAIESAILAKKKKIPYILQPHGACAVRKDLGIIGEAKRVFDNTIGKYLLENAAAAIALTKIEAMGIRRIAQKARVEIIPNGLEEVDFKKPQKKTVEKFRELADGAHIIVTVARIHPVKSIPEIIPAIAEAQKHIGEKITYIIGGPDDGDAARVVRAAKQYGVDVRLTGPVYDAEKRALLAAGDIFLLPSRYEGFPLTILEAMAQGTTPVVSDKGGSKEVVGHLGYVFKYMDVMDAAKKIISAIKKPVDPNALIAYAKQHRWSAIVRNRYIPLLENMLSNRP